MRYESNLPRLLTVEQLATLWSSTPDTIRRLARQGDLPGLKLDDGHRSRWLFSEDDIARFLAERRGQGPS